ncbi:thioredoxin family protein [Pseudacidobacterium ailaaui]|jgi:thioredoxin 1|uniref:thioredoxin family protein n=1 Tax=Pseudacidobacterium ailaaui TaxID=1382359 RepID=UPI000679E80E|nr:thioredoxin family protein [Pseudacidobacterium ailaaui]MBX6359413.1 thioredoxin family protein [Pseudacidobacterium ailaaui]MCL6463915.1 thioredoxin family protein [Pseudacidobacterium ailaaui]MDI3253601.1 thioredoxin family protein [Bacillota bacterium]
MHTSARKNCLALIATLLFTCLAASGQGRTIYSDTADAHKDIAQALAQARREHKRVILDFGGNWCGDCQVLDIYLHQQPNLDLLNRYFVLVHINVGRFDRNTDIAEKYQVPLKKGVPALAILSATGRLLYSQKNGEFEAMRRMDPASVTQFLQQWKPTKS